MTTSMLHVVTAVGVGLAASWLASVPVAGSQEKLKAATARNEIEGVYEAWGRARVGHDEKAIDSMLSSDFYVLLNERRISREEFVAMVLRDSPDRRLARFDVDVLTLQESEEGWTAVIAEKLEVEIRADDGTTQEAYSLWVTRDGLRKDGDRWAVTFSEAIGYQKWPPGERPPFEDW